MATIQRYNITDRVAVSFTGNTLGLLGTFNPSQSTNSSNADGIGTFTSINTSLQAPGGYPVGTTTNYSQNSSSAVLSMLPGSTVLYAELIWSGSQSTALQDVSGSLNNAVQLKTPLGNTVSVSPSPATAQSIANFFGSINIYTRTANITNVVQNAGAGTYTLSNVPCALGGTFTSSPNNVESNYLGWTLCVIYKNGALPYRNATFWVLFSAITGTNTVDVPISGFLTPSSGPINARLATSVGSGDNYIAGDGVSFGPNTSNLTVLSGPNNLSNNFFASQLNVGNSESANVGQLDTSGTFGNANQPTSGNKVAGARQGWDVTNINVSSAMTNNQSSAVTRFFTNGDYYAPVALALQVNVSTPDLNPSTAKRVDKNFASLGDEITYTIVLRNSGQITATNVVFVDTIPSSTNFVPNSLFINGSPSALSPAPPGISIGTIGVNATTTIIFKVSVASVPSNNIVQNTGSVGYNFTPNPLTPAVFDNVSTNTVTTTINYPSITSTKTASRSNTIVGDELIYTISLRNNGSLTATNVIFTDTIPTGTDFVNNSVLINNVPQSGLNPAPPTGINLGSLGPLQTVTVQFRVNVSTIPTINPIPNSSTTNYTLVVNTTLGTTLSGSSNSNIVNTFVNPTSNPLKTITQQYATVGETIKYTILWTNKLNVAQTNVIVIDTIPNDTTFVPNSITIDNVSKPGLTINPPAGLSVGTLPAGQSVTITFDVKVNTIPSPNPIPNQATVGYNFITDPTAGTSEHETSPSNTVNTQVNYAVIDSLTKSSDKLYSTIGEELSYTMVFKTRGNVNLENVLFSDTIPNGTSFVDTSLYVNGLPTLPSSISPRLQVDLQTLSPNTTNTVIFKVRVNTIPSPNPIPNSSTITYKYVVDPTLNVSYTNGINSNTVYTTINYADINSILKSVDKGFSNIGEILTYTLVLKNSGNIVANNVVLIDTIPTDTLFVNDSVYINNTRESGVSPAPPTGLSLGNIAPGSTVTVTFQITTTTIPNPNPIENTATTTYSYVVNPTVPSSANGGGNSNTAFTSIINASLVNMTKSVDKVFASCGDILTYTIVVPNSGNTNAVNVILRDTIPSGTILVSDSVTINGVTSPAGTSPLTGINLGTIPANNLVTVTFKVKINC